MKFEIQVEQENIRSESLGAKIHCNQAWWRWWHPEKVCVSQVEQCQFAPNTTWIRNGDGEVEALNRPRQLSVVVAV